MTLVLGQILEKIHDETKDLTVSSLEQIFPFDGSTLAVQNICLLPGAYGTASTP